MDSGLRSYHREGLGGVPRGTKGPPRTEGTSQEPELRDRKGRSDQGLISGYVLKLTRESLGLTQEALADRLRVDKHTVQAWESGRRPMGATQVAGFVDL